MQFMSSKQEIPPASPFAMRYTCPSTHANRESTAPTCDFIFWLRTEKIQDHLGGAKSRPLGQKDIEGRI